MLSGILFSGYACEIYFQMFLGYLVIYLRSSSWCFYFVFSFSSPLVPLFWVLVAPVEDVLIALRTPSRFRGGGVRFHGVVVLSLDTGTQSREGHKGTQGANRVGDDGLPLVTWRWFFRIIGRHPLPCSGAGGLIIFWLSFLATKNAHYFFFRIRE